MAFLNKFYPLKYKEVFLFKPLFRKEGVAVIAPVVSKALLSYTLKCTIAEVDAEYICLDISDTENSISVHIERIIYLNELNEFVLEG